MNHTTSAYNDFSLEKFNNAIEKLKELPPIAVEMQVFREGYNAIKDNISITNGIRKEELQKPRNNLYGIRVIAIDKSEEPDLKYNQAKVIYSDGSSKIIDIFKV